jgi:uncharacterized protein (TIGR03083 family)
MKTRTKIPIDVVGLLPVLDKKLLELLKSLTPDEWNQQTIAKLWTVKDVAAHLVDGNIRLLSILRDNYFGEIQTINSNQDLIDFLNGLNAEWVKAMKRVSPQMLIFLHEKTGQSFCDYLKTIKPFDRSPISVDWVGETESKNWMEIAREYTEEWLHQQQIRDAVNKPALMSRELYFPFIDISMLALPHTYRTIEAVEGVTVKVTVTTDIGGSWMLMRSKGNWTLTKNDARTATAEIMIDPDTSWKLFSKSLRPDQIMDKVKILGEQKLGEVALNMVSVMA